MTATPMAIRVTLDRVLLDRRMSLTELGDRVGITLANLSILSNLRLDRSLQLKLLRSYEAHSMSPDYPIKFLLNTPVFKISLIVLHFLL